MTSSSEMFGEKASLTPSSYQQPLRSYEKMPQRSVDLFETSQDLSL